MTGEPQDGPSLERWAPQAPWATNVAMGPLYGVVGLAWCIQSQGSLQLNSDAHARQTHSSRASTRKIYDLLGLKIKYNLDPARQQAGSLIGGRKDSPWSLMLVSTVRALRPCPL